MNRVRAGTAAFNNVIKALTETNKKKGFVPWRDHAVTYILKRYLDSGPTKTIILATISPADD